MTGTNDDINAVLYLYGNGNGGNQYDFSSPYGIMDNGAFALSQQHQHANQMGRAHA